MTYPGRPNSSWYTYQTVGSGLRDLGRMLFQQQQANKADQRYQEERDLQFGAQRSADLALPGASTVGNFLQSTLKADQAAGLPSEVSQEVPPIDISNIANVDAPSAPLEFRPPPTREVPLPPTTVGGEMGSMTVQPPTPYQTATGVVIDPEQARQQGMGAFAEQEMFRQSLAPQVPRNIDPLSEEGVAAAIKRHRGETQNEIDLGIVRGEDQPKRMTYPQAQAALLKLYGITNEFGESVWPDDLDFASRDKAIRELIEGKVPQQTPTSASIGRMQRREFPVGATGGGAYFDLTGSPQAPLGPTTSLDVTQGPQPPIAGRQQELPQWRFNMMIEQLKAQNRMSDEQARAHLASLGFVVAKADSAIVEPPIGR